MTSRMDLDDVGRNLSGGYRAVFDALRARASKGNLPVYLVGGPVRDFLLGRVLRDLDFSVEGDAPSLARELAKEHGGSCVVHQRFRTATVEVDGAKVDLITARKETYRRPGALPEVTPGTIQDDLARRDFSINAMALPLAKKKAAVLDPQRGLDDVRQSVVRTLHPGSFADDPTRLMRAVRYEQRLSFSLEAATLVDLQAEVAQGRLHLVSADRWRHELGRMLEEQQPGEVLERAHELGLLSGLWPALVDLEAVVRLRQWSRDRPGEATPADWLAALVYHLTSSDGDGLAQRLRFPADWSGLVRDTISLRNLETELGNPAIRPSELVRILVGHDPAVVAAMLKLTDSPQVRQNLQLYETRLRLQTPQLAGEELLKMGVPQGPAVGEILEKLRAACLDGEVATVEDERALVRRLMSGG